MLLPTVLFQRFALVSPSSIEDFDLLLTNAVLPTLSISKMCTPYIRRPLICNRELTDHVICNSYSHDPNAAVKREIYRKSKDLSKAVVSQSQLPQGTSIIGLGTSSPDDRLQRDVGGCCEGNT